MNRIPAAIIGSGNIGTDLMYKIRRSSLLELAWMCGVIPESEGLARARRLGYKTTDLGIDDLLRHADDFQIAFDEPCMHEAVFSDKKQKASGATTMDIAKRLIDFGFHPPTIYFPLVVHGAMMIEPTETETKETLDEFVVAMRAIARECRETPDVVKGAPHHTALSRLDEVQAARKPVLRWRRSEDSPRSHGDKERRG